MIIHVRLVINLLIPTINLRVNVSVALCTLFALETIAEGAAGHHTDILYNAYLHTQIYIHNITCVHEYCRCTQIVHLRMNSRSKLVAYAPSPVIYYCSHYRIIRSDTICCCSDIGRIKLYYYSSSPHPHPLAQTPHPNTTPRDTHTPTPTPDQEAR